jgi:hypothetical protein
MRVCRKNLSFEPLNFPPREYAKRKGWTYQLDYKEAQTTCTYRGNWLTCREYANAWNVGEHAITSIPYV